MQGTILHIGWKVDGSLTANNVRRFQAPFRMQLVRVNAGCDNTTSMKVKIGTAADESAYLNGWEVTGAAASTTLFELDHFPDDQYPAIPVGTEVVATMDYDGGAAGDADNPHMDLWFTY